MIVIEWSPQKKARLATRIASSPHWFERTGLTAQLAAARGDYCEARRIASEGVAAAGIIASEHMFVELAIAAFIAQDLELLVRMIADRYSGFRPTLYIVEGRDPKLGPVTKWHIAGSKSTFTFSDSIYKFDQTDTTFLMWLWLLPMFHRHTTHELTQAGSVDVSLWDSGIAPGLAFCDWRENFFLIPDPHFVEKRGYKEVRDHFAIADVPWTERAATAIWRGSTTGGAVDWRRLQRIRLCQIAKSLGDEVLDAGITRIVQIANPGAIAEIRTSGLCKPHVDWRNLSAYKYQIDVDGNTNAWSGLFQRLMTGSPVLKVISERGYRQWYYDRLVPWKNFVPVAADMSDLAEKVSMLREDDGLAEAIGRAGRELALSLDYDRELLCATRTIDAAVRFNVSQTGGASR